MLSSNSSNSSNPRRPPSRLGSSSAHKDSVAFCYIQDDSYSWLPARILERAEEEDYVTVQVCLPPNWLDTTTLSPDSTILELEESMADGANDIPTVTRVIDLEDYVGGELPLQNLDRKGKLLGKRDMADLPFLHEAAILFNLKERHANGQPYTRVGDIVVAMNPCQWITGLYSEEKRNVYADFLIWNSEENEDEEDDVDESKKDNVLATFGSLYDKLGFDPHVYETSSLAYRGLAVDQVNQTILVTGESGAGKTETVKIVMKHLATLEKTRPGYQSPDAASSDNTGVVERVLESSPVFEAFGNAKTLRNNNSSRFGKFTQLQFDLETPGAAERGGRLIPMCELAGSVCVTYLLEKSRVVSHSPNERTYHIFYQLLAAPDDWKRDFVWDGLDGATAESFRYVGLAQEIEGEASDADQWQVTKKALELFSLEGQKLQTLLRALCVVLQLGNLLFDEDPASGASLEGGAVISNPAELDKLVDLMGMDAATLEGAMTKKVLKTGYDEVSVHLRPTEAKESCDALAKEIYARIFDVLVRNINRATRAADAVDDKDDTYGLISLLDIFGFERFQVNRFEQLCINYANEQLQHKYVLDNFQQVKEEYEDEGIEIFDFSVVDNSSVLTLLEGRLGLIISLNEECIRPKGNDEAFVYKIKIAHKEHERLIDENLHLRTEFGVHHFAGPVTYDAHKFVERNTDKLPQDLLACASQSKNDLIREELQGILNAQNDDVAMPVRRRKATNRTVLQKFQRQLRQLMRDMEDTRTRYIRCIKPNDKMVPRRTEHYTTMRQLECAGLVTAITISRESFPNKLGYEVTRDRFDCLMTDQDRQYMTNVDLRDAVQYMLTNLLFAMVEEHPNGTMTLPFACGNTKIYFRAGALEQLETKRLDYFTTRIVVIQRWIRKLQAQARFEEMRRAVVLMQAIVRGRLEWKRYKEQQQAAVIMQCWIRSRQAMSEMHQLRVNQAATVIQANYRRKVRRYELRRMKRAAKIIQRAVRNKEKKDRMTAKLATAVEEARMDNKLLGLKEQVSDTASLGPQTASSLSSPSAKGRQVNEELLIEIENMFDYLRKEIFMLRGKNADLKTELRDAETDKREILSHAESAEAAASASRLRVAQLTKNNSTLMAEIIEQKHEVSSLKKELKASSDHKEEVVANIKTDHELQLRQQEAEIKSLQAGIRETRSTAEYEKRLLKDELSKMEEEHMSEVMRLKDELRRTQDSHHDYLAKLMDVLETTHSAREGEMARISAELNAVKEEKDAQILSLQQEVESLRQLNKTDVSAIQSRKVESKVSEVTTVRREVEKNQLVRGQRGQKFFEVVDKLTTAVSSENLVAITSHRRGRGKKLSALDEESQRMKKMVRFLSDLYALEESSQAKVDSDMLRMLDSYKAAAEPNRMLSELEFQVKQIEAENKRLKEQVRLHGNCPRCEARDKRRAARQKAGGGGSTGMSSTPPSRTSSNASSQYSNTQTTPTARRPGGRKTYRGNY